MLIRIALALFINWVIIFNTSMTAQANDFLMEKNETKITQVVDSFFVKHPNKNIVTWLPEINGKSKYAFLIPKDAFLVSKKYKDGSDLYYLSKKIDNGLMFRSKKPYNLDFYIFKDNFKTIIKKRFLSEIDVGAFLEKKNNSFGIISYKNFIPYKNTLGSFGFEQAKDDYTLFNLRFVKLSKDENSELFTNLSHKLKSNILDMNVGYTWFEVNNTFDFTMNINQKNNKVTSSIYVSNGEENMKFQIGLIKKRNNSNVNIFFNLRFDDLINKRRFQSKINISSKTDNINDNSLSLKNFRKQSLDLLWRQNFKF